MPAKDPAIRVLMMPKDTTGYGTIFGGVILSHIDLASAVEAHRVAAHRYVTRAMHAVEFHQPVLVGDLVSFYTEVTRIGNTSVTVRVLVEAQRWSAPVGPAGTGTGTGTVRVTEAEVVLVAVDAQGQPIPVKPASDQRA